MSPKNSKYYPSTHREYREKSKNNKEITDTKREIENKTLKDKVKDDRKPEIVASCQTNNITQLPIINIKFGDQVIPALLDTGANLSLIQPDTLESIKNFTKVQYISRSVKIYTLNNATIPYLSAVNLKFRLGNKWLTNQFFVTQQNWTSKYQIILGYDFIQKNKILIDTNKNQLIIDNAHFNFMDSENNINDHINEEMHNNNNTNQNTEISDSVRVALNTIIHPKTAEIVKLIIPENMRRKQQVLFSPYKNKLKNLDMTESIHEINDKQYIFTMIENNSNSNIVLRKGEKIGKIHEIEDNQFQEPVEQQNFQINHMTLKEIRKLRKEELSPDDFDLKHLEADQKTKMIKMLMQNSAVFSKSYSTLGETDAVVPTLNLLHNFPIQTKPYTIPRIAKKYAQEEIAKLLEAGIIEPTTSNYSFPVIFVKKKSPPDADPSKLKFRMAVDYRLLNCITESYQICLPRISEILHNIAGKEYYCVLDLKSAFFQIKLDPRDKEKLAFCTELGNFQPTRLPFGARNSSSYFHTLISKCLGDMQGPNLQYFLDDIIVAANSIDELLKILQSVFDKLKQFNLTLDPSKMQFCKQEITYLGFCVNSKGFAPSEGNIQKVATFPRPRNVKEVQKFVGMLNYFRHLIFNYAEIIKPIVNLTKKNIPFIWNEQCQNALEKVQEIILEKPTIKNIENDKPLYLVTDASRTAICGILMQKENNKFFPVQFYSKILTPAEARYPSIRRELYAIFRSVKQFHEHLYGKKFIILTDAKPLTFHINLDKQPDIVARWLLYLQEFQYTMEHIPGFKNPADYLSRVLDEGVVNSINVFKINDNLSSQNIITKQQEDPYIKTILKKLQDKHKDTIEKYFIDSHTNVLMIKLKPNNPKTKNRSIQNKILIPKSLIKDILQTVHMPHFGIKKTYEFVKAKYYWKGMYSDTENFVKNCSNCLENKSKPQNTRPRLIPKKDLAPGELIAIDLIGKLPRSTDNKFYVLTIIDHYSRYLEAIPLNNCTSQSIIHSLNEYFGRFGIAKILLSDNGTYFCSAEFNQFLKSLNIDHRKSSIYYPQANGLIEKVHKIMKESIASISNKIFEWPKKVLMFKLYYNNAKHTVTQFSPAELFFGRALNTPIDGNNPLKLAEDFQQYSKKIKDQIESNKEQVKINEDEYFSCREKYLKGRKIPELNLGDKVFIQNFNENRVLQPKYKGPYEVIKKLRNDNYIIQLEDKTTKVHVSKLFRQKPLRIDTEEENVRL